MNRFTEISHNGKTYFVEKSRILGTKINVYDVNELSSFMGNHSTITSDNGKYYGKITSRRLPKELEGLTPMSLERINKVSDWKEDLTKLSHTIIYLAFPHLQNIEVNECSNGDIWTYNE